jgi:hypothetical protein
MQGLRIVSLLFVMAVSATAAAEEYDPPVRPFVLPDLSGLTMVGLDFQLTHWTEHLPLDVDIGQTNLTFDLKAEVALAPHLVVLATLPVVYHSSEDVTPVDGDECCALALGNFTAGVRGLASGRLGAARSVIGGTVTVSLPSANDQGDRGGSAAASTLAHAPHDPGLYAPNTTTIRLGGAAQLYGRWFFVEPELGVHLFIYDEDIENDDSDVAIRLGVAAGVRATEALAILAETNNMIFLDDGGQRTSDDVISSIDVGLRYGTPAFLLGARAYVPVDGNLRDRDMLGFGLDVGGRF